MTLAADLLSRFEKGELSAEQEREVVRELLDLASLPEAAAFLPPRPASDPSAFAEPFARASSKAEDALARRNEAERRAPELLADLADHSFEHQLTLVRNQRRYATFAFVHHLCESSLAIGAADVQRCEELARLAVAAAEQAAASSLSPRLARDLEAEAWGQLGNALRLRFDLRAAAAAFVEASRRLADGSGDPLAEAHLLSLRASLAADRGDFQAALALCRRATGLQREVGARLPLGRTLVQIAAYAAEAELFSEAFDAANEAAGLVDCEREPRMAFALQHNRAYCLERMGQPLAARQELVAARRLAEQSRRRSDLARVSWIEGRVAADLGEPAEAERRLREAAAAFVALDDPFDTALVSLELALVLLAQGRAEGVRELATQMVAVFASQEIEPEARAAAQVFQAAAAREALDRIFLLRLLSYFEKTRLQPGLCFDPRG